MYRSFTSVAIFLLFLCFLLSIRHLLSNICEVFLAEKKGGIFGEFSGNFRGIISRYCQIPAASLHVFLCFGQFTPVEPVPRNEKARIRLGFGPFVDSIKSVAQMGLIL